MIIESRSIRSPVAMRRERCMPSGEHPSSSNLVKCVLDSERLDVPPRMVTGLLSGTDSVESLPASVDLFHPCVIQGDGSFTPVRAR